MQIYVICCHISIFRPWSGQLSSCLFSHLSPLPFWFFSYFVSCVFVCLHICLSCAFLVSVEISRVSNPLRMEFQMVLSYHVGSGNWTSIHWKSSQGIWPASHLLSRNFLSLFSGPLVSFACICDSKHDSYLSGFHLFYLTKCILIFLQMRWFCLPFC